MDVRAFGGVYAQSAILPFASGFMVSAGTDKAFPACRAIFVESANKNADKTLTVSLSDSPSNWITFSHIRADTLIPISATAISGSTTAEHVYIFY